MLTADGLKQIAGLTEDQISSIVTLSKNDEDFVVGQALKKVHDSYDNDFKEVLGVEKPADQKSYAFWKEQIKAVKAEAAKVKASEASITALAAEKKALEDKIAEGKGSEAITEKLQKIEKDLNDERNVAKGLKATLAEKDAEIAKVKADAANESLGMLAEIEFNAALSNVQINKTIDADVVKSHIRTAKELVLKTGKPEVQEVDGVKRIIFRDENGNIIANPKNLQNPFTIQDLFTDKIKGVVVEQKIVNGGGAGQNGKPTVNVDISQARTKTEATTLINKDLAARGLVQGTEEFLAASQEAFNSLPKEMPVQ